MMKPFFTSLISGLVTGLGWLLTVTILGFLLRINWELFMIGWRFL